MTYVSVKYMNLMFFFLLLDLNMDHVHYKKLIYTEESSEI